MAFAVEKYNQAGALGASVVRPGKTRRLFSGALVFGAGVAAATWMLATFATMHSMATAVSTEGQSGFETSLGLKPIPRPAPQQRLVQIEKFSRLTIRPTPMELSGLTADAVRLSHTKSVAKRELTAALAAKLEQRVALARAKPVLATDLPSATAAASPAITTAYAEIGPVMPTNAMASRFDLVLQDKPVEDAHVLPSNGPVPLSRPQVVRPEASAEIARSTPSESAEKPGKQTKLAYAKPDMPIADDDDDDAPAFSRPLFGSRKGIAYYDISAGVVHMPNGEKLVAHSGIGKMRDNPDFVHVKMRGPTPPGTYKVTMRETLFHGVAAVRLTPTNGVAPHGRVGLLAHSYLLRNRGDSHGCVAFEDYPRFLKAFKRGEVTQMVIVKSMKGGFAPQKKTLASLFSRKS